MLRVKLEKGDILQINPECKFGGMFLVVDEPKSFGAQGYLLSSRDFKAVKFDGRAFLRVNYEDVAFCGKIHWVEEDKKEGDVSENEVSI